MKKLFLTLATGAMLAGCSQLTPQQHDTAVAVSHAAIDLFQKASDIIVQVIVARAQSPADASAKANLLDSVAGGLRSIEGQSSGLITTSDVGAVVREFTDPEKVHWSDLADQLMDSFALARGSTDAKLETMAVAANAKAAELRSAQ